MVDKESSLEPFQNGGRFVYLSSGLVDKESSLETFQNGDRFVYLSLGMFIKGSSLTPGPFRLPVLGQSYQGMKLGNFSKWGPFHLPEFGDD